MIHTIFIAFLLFITAAGPSFAAENEPVNSLTITEHPDAFVAAPGQPFPAGSKTVVAIKGTSETDRQFLSGLWQANRALFKDANMEVVGPDASYDDIEFIHGGEKLSARSWHRQMEANPNAVTMSWGVTSLDGKTREEALSKDEKWFLEFRKGFDSIYEAAVEYAASQ